MFYGKKAKIKLLTKTAMLAGVFGFVAIFGIFAFYAKDLPSPASITELKIAESTKIYDRTGEVLLYDIHGEQKRTVIATEDMPAYVKYATIVAEDDSFYKHFGVDFKGIGRAALSNIQNKGIEQGGSTITQQLIKNIYLTPERTIARKIKELILAIEMELKYDKEQILSFYLNIVPYGSNAYGIEAASQTFFSKHAKNLSLAEAALLASLPNAPTYYSPFGNNPEKLKKRQEYILNRMLALGYITQEQYDEAKDADLGYNNDEDDIGIKAPHFVMHTIEYLEEKYGGNKLKNSGFNVVTTIDWELQKEAEGIIEKWAEINEKRFNARNAALVAIDPKTGQILAMVGSRNYLDQENDGNVNVTTRLRQPGSSFKPFAYAKAFEKGYTPDTILFDVFTEFNPNCKPDGMEEKDSYGLDCYHPGNYSGTFRGPITMKEALAQSVNVAAVKVLHLAGVQNTIELARSMGITSLNEPDRYGLSLVLGGGEVTLLDETSAYGAFSQGGVLNKPTGILKITDKDGKVMEEFRASPEEVLDEQVARLITSILSNNDYRAPVFGQNSYLNLGHIPAAVKTGTTQEYRDAWTVGYTPDITVGVWAGNNIPSTMPRGAGANVAAPIWNDFMKKTYEIKGYSIKQFTQPEPIETAKPVLNGTLGGSITLKIDKISGKLASEYTPPELIEERGFYEPHSLLYFVEKDNPQGKRPVNPENDSQFRSWEEAIQNWLEQENINFDSSNIPTDYDDVHTKENMPKATITKPVMGFSYSENSIVPVSLYIQSVFEVNKIEIFFDDQVVKTIADPNLRDKNFSTSFRIPQNTTSGLHLIKVRIFDSVLNRSDSEVLLTIN